MSSRRCMQNTADGPSDHVEDYLCDPEEMPLGSRECKLPCPEDCVISEWGPWTRCTLVWWWTIYQYRVCPVFYHESFRAITKKNNYEVTKLVMKAWVFSRLLHSMTVPFKVSSVLSHTRTAWLMQVLCPSPAQNTFRLVYKYTAC